MGHVACTRELKRRAITLFAHAKRVSLYMRYGAAAGRQCRASPCKYSIGMLSVLEACIAEDRRLCHFQPRQRRSSCDN